MQSHPSWVRGLKFGFTVLLSGVNEVAPLVGAWIEIDDLGLDTVLRIVAPLVGAWIEIRRKLTRKE